MKKTSFFLSALGAILMLTTMSSCNKEKSATVVFWQREQDAIDLNSFSIDVLKFYIDGEYIGSIGSTEYFDSEPGCDGNSGGKHVVDLNGNDLKTIKWSVKDEDGIEWNTGTVVLNDGDCAATYLW
jgi:hypothetical protein